MNIVIVFFYKCYCLVALQVIEGPTQVQPILLSKLPKEDKSPVKSVYIAYSLLHSHYSDDIAKLMHANEITKENNDFLSIREY